ncbi:AAA family ATPase [Phycicoccus avicenniae]|uniref:AAA family ATPase n=1 Tax=Phycicoccus avicenniae TaxID=2828860 RepID=UPI003D2850C5
MTDRHLTVADLAEPPPDEPRPDERTPPNDHRAEQAVLGSMLFDPRGAVEITGVIDGHHFYYPRHETIYEALRKRVHSLKPIERYLLANDLRDAGTLARCGGTVYLEELYQLGIAVPTDAALHFADEVRRTAARRRLVEAGTRIMALGYTPSDTPPAELHHTALDTLERDLILQPVPGVDEEVGDRFLDFTTLYTTPPQPIPWLIAPILAEGRITLLYAPGKAGKSLVAMEAACALATGGLALTQRTPHHPVHVLYVDQEQTPEDWRDRTQAMGYTVQDAAELTEHLHVSNLQAWAPLDTVAGGAQLLAEVRRTGARVVIIDTVSKVVAGEENSNDTHQALYRHTLAPLKREGLAVLLLDHTGKDLEKGARGGSAKTDNIDIAYQLTPRSHDKLTLAPTHVRFRDDATSRTITLVRSTIPRLTHVEDTWSDSTSPAAEFRPTRFMEKISRLVEATPGLSKSEVLDLVTGRAEYKRKALATLIAEGYIEDVRGQHNKATLGELKPYREASDPMASDRPDGDQDGTP